MENKETLKNRILLPVLFVVSLVITMVYLYPNFSGKVLNQSDVIQAAGGHTEVNKYKKEQDKQILWTNSMFSGMPTYQVYLEHEDNFIKRFILNPLTQNLPSPFSIFLISLVSSFLLFYALKFNPWVSFISSLIFTYSCFNIVSIEAGHLNKILAFAFTPAVWAGVVLVFDRKWVAGAVVSLLSVALQLASNHPQITYYTLLGVGIYFVYQLLRAIREKQFKSLLVGASVLVLSLGLGLGTNASLLWTTYEYSKETIRGGAELSDAPNKGASGLDKGYAFSWSYGIGETLDLIIPAVNGGASGEELSKRSETYKAMIEHGVPRSAAENFAKSAPTYWGKQPFTGGPSYMGIVAFLFFLYYMLEGLRNFKMEGRITLLSILRTIFSGKSARGWIFGMFIFSLFMAWGKNFSVFANFMFDYFPLYNKFRTPAMAMSLTLFSISIGAGFGIMTLLENLKADPAKEAKRFLIVAASLGGFCLLIALAPALFLSFENEAIDESIKGMIGGENWLLEAIQSDRASLARMDALRSGIFVALSALLVWLLSKDMLKPAIFSGILAVLVLVDMLGVDSRYMSPGDFKPKKVLASTASPADRQILQDPDIHYRVFDVTRGPFADATPSLFHKSIGGYHAAKLRRYQDLIERHLSKQNMAVLDMLNAKYVIISDAEGRPQAMPNPGALGNAWFVNNFKWAATPDDEINGLTGFNPATTAVINEKDKAYVNDLGTATDSTARIKLVSYFPDDMKYESVSAAPGLAVFSEIYYNSGKGWEAYIDGQKTEHIRVNYVLRALKIPAGKHSIEFKFEPQSFKKGSLISLVSSVLVLVLSLAGIAFVIYKKRKQAQA